VAVRIEDVQALYGLDIRLSFDPAVVEVVDADPNTSGIQLSPGDLLALDFSIRNTADNAEGTIWFALTQLNPSEITFKGKAEGASCPIAITYAKLSSRDGDAIPADTSDGTLRVVQAAAAAATPTETAPPSQPRVVTPTGQATEPPSASSTPEPANTATPEPTAPASTEQPAEPTAIPPTDTPIISPATNTPTALLPTMTAMSPTDTATSKPTPTVGVTNTPIVMPTALCRVPTATTKGPGAVAQQVQPTQPAPTQLPDAKPTPGASLALWIILGGIIGLPAIAWGAWAILGRLERLRPHRKAESTRHKE